MNADRFRQDLDAYEHTLAQWTKFVVSTSGKPVIPNRLSLEDDGGLWLVYEVPDGGDAIKCKGGKIVRILQLGLANEAAEARH